MSKAERKKKDDFYFSLCLVPRITAIEIRIEGRGNMKVVELRR
jgi:hypothetical protein